MRAVDVGDTVDVQFGGHRFVDLAQEGQGRLVPVGRLADNQNRAKSANQSRAIRGL